MMLNPPSTKMISPVIAPARSDARNARGVADVLLRDVGAHRGDLVERAVELAEVADPARGQRPDRAGGDRVDPDALGPEVGGEVADRRLERRLGDAHHVVVGRDALGAEVGEGEDRAAAVEVAAGRRGRCATSE